MGWPTGDISGLRPQCRGVETRPVHFFARGGVDGGPPMAPSEKTRTQGASKPPPGGAILSENPGNHQRYFQPPTRIRVSKKWSVSPSRQPGSTDQTAAYPTMAACAGTTSIYRAVSTAGLQSVWKELQTPGVLRDRRRSPWFPSSSGRRERYPLRA